MAEVTRVDVRGAELAKLRAEDKTISVGKPPWTEVEHTGKIERLILQLGAGKGRFDEVHGIPRSIGCIGNNRFILRREKLTFDEIRTVLREFKVMGGKEVWINSYDRIEELQYAAQIALSFGIPNVNATVLFEDLEEVEPLDGINYIAEMEYDEEKIITASMKLWVKGLLIMVPPERLEEAKMFIRKVKGDSELEIYLDVLYPRSARDLSFNLIELRRNKNPTSVKYHDCLAGTVAVTGDGYITPCPLLRNFAAGDVRDKGLKWTVNKTRKIRKFWTLTKDSVEGCSSCPFRYLCHDCRAIEYQVTGDLNGIEYCPLVFSSESQKSSIE
ncbi:SPASM domain-containing protein [Thermococcus profundus]|nr:SPASM domain-containing protein [Thermococcus profundus]